MRLIIALAVSAAMALPAISAAQDVGGVQYPGMMDYGIWPKSKIVEKDGHKFRIWFHPHKPYIMIQPTFAGTVNAQFSHMDLSYWQEAAQTIIEPYGCKVTDVAAKSKMGATWNAKYLCPDDKVINPNDPSPTPTLTSEVPTH